MDSASVLSVFIFFSDSKIFLLEIVRCNSTTLLLIEWFSLYFFLFLKYYNCLCGGFSKHYPTIIPHRIIFKFNLVITQGTPRTRLP